MLVRLFCAFYTAFIVALIVKFAGIGLKPDTSIRGWRYALIRVSEFFGCGIVLASTGVVWYRFDRPTACYKKYLGPEWEPDYDWRRECGCIVSNHSSLFDTFVLSM